MAVAFSATHPSLMQNLQMMASGYMRAFWRVYSVHFVQETSPNVLRRWTQVDGMRHITPTQAVTVDYWVTWHVRHDRR